MTFNTAIAAVMELLNDAGKFEVASEGDRAVMQEVLETAVLVLAPITPHIGHELWEALGHEEPVVNAEWPVADETAMKEDRIELVIQVNGKAALAAECGRQCGQGIIGGHGAGGRECPALHRGYDHSQGDCCARQAGECGCKIEGS